MTTTQLTFLGFTKPLTEEQFDELNSITYRDYDFYLECFEETEVSQESITLPNNYFTEDYPHIDSSEKYEGGYIKDFPNDYTLIFYVTDGSDYSKEAGKMIELFKKYK